jgi:hypothetical protein
MVFVAASYWSLGIQQKPLLMLYLERYAIQSATISGLILISANHRVTVFARENS